MRSENIALYSLEFSDARSYLLTAGFVGGNIVLPQLCHLLPQGGAMLLPIYLFTLIGAYKFGWRVGLLTALISPVANHLLFGMPAVGVLPIILIKSIALALAAGYAAQRLRYLPLMLALVVVVLAYQCVGACAESIIVRDPQIALQNVRLGAAGMAIQVVGGAAIIKSIIRL